MLKIIKDSKGQYTESSVFIINCYMVKYKYTSVQQAIDHIERDNEHERLNSIQKLSVPIAPIITLPVCPPYPSDSRD